MLIKTNKITSCLIIFLFHTLIHSKADSFDERLLIKPLPSGHVYSQFQFTIEMDLESNDKSAFLHFRLFPRSIGEIISKYDVQELHFSLTQGLWRYEKWGYSLRDAPPGAELWTIFKGNLSKVSENWKKLTNILSGQFCASLNFIDDTTTVVPKLSFKPKGVIDINKYNSSFTRYSALPRENVCTENLTPFRKILPCGYQAGLTTLLNALNIFNAHYVSLAVDVQTIYKENCTNVSLQLVLSVGIVFDLPIQLKKQDFSLVKLFGSSLTSTCPVATNSKIFVDITSNKTGIPFTLSITPTEVIETYNSINHSSTKDSFAVYDLKNMFKTNNFVNIAAVYSKAHIHGIIPPPFLYVDRKISGYGQEEGGIFCTFYNNHPKKSLKVIYFDVIPWFIRLYSHTLILKSGNKIIKPEYLHYTPGKDRSRPQHLELVFTVPPKSKTEMNIEFDFAFLKWTEYPPDANHGFYIGSPVISFLLDSNKNFSYFPGYRQTRSEDVNFLRIHSKILLVSLPTPDFSMPYNVICLTCTVVALAFGPIHNITTRKLQPFDENTENPYVAKLKKQVKLWWETWKKGNQPEEKKSQ